MADLFKQMGPLLDLMNLNHAEATMPGVWLGLGVVLSHDGKHKFAEVWWPGYARKAYASSVTWQMPDDTKVEMVIGNIRYDAARRFYLHINGQAQFDADGKITSAGTLGNDAWLSPGDTLRVQSYAHPDK